MSVSLEGMAAKLMNLYEGHEVIDTRIRGTKAVLEHLDRLESIRAASNCLELLCLIDGVHSVL